VLTITAAADEAARGALRQILQALAHIMRSRA